MEQSEANSWREDSCQRRGSQTKSSQRLMITNKLCAEELKGEKDSVLVVEQLPKSQEMEWNKQNTLQV